MKTTVSKTGIIRMTATSKKDSLSLLKFLSKAAGNNDPEREKLIQLKELELMNQSKNT